MSDNAFLLLIERELERARMQLQQPRAGRQSNLCRALQSSLLSSAPRNGLVIAQRLALMLASSRHNDVTRYCGAVWRSVHPEAARIVRLLKEQGGVARADFLQF